MKILVTRPQPDAGDFAKRCRRAGLEPVLSPLMTVNFLKTQLDTAKIDAFAFTSMNGVRAVSAFEDKTIPVFAVGDMTAECARAAGFENVSAAKGDVNSLADLISSAGVAGDILHVAGAHRAGDLVAALQTRGVAARREVLYEARAVDSLPPAAKAALMADPPVDWVALFSPRTAALLLALVNDAGLGDRLRHVRAVCLSAAVADKLENAAWKSVAAAPRRDAEAMIETITRFAPKNRA